MYLPIDREYLVANILVSPKKFYGLTNNLLRPSDAYMHK